MLIKFIIYYLMQGVSKLNCHNYTSMKLSLFFSKSQL